MKNLLKFAYYASVLLVSISCTTESVDSVQLNELNQQELNDPCVDQDPISRVVNNGTVSFDFKVIDDQGVVLAEISNIPASTTTSWVSFPQGEILFSLDSDQTLVNDDKVVLQMGTCMAYEIEIDSNNQIVSYTPIAL